MMGAVPPTVRRPLPQNVPPGASDPSFNQTAVVPSKVAVSPDVFNLDAAVFGANSNLTYSSDKDDAVRLEWYVLASKRPYIVDNMLNIVRLHASKTIDDSQGFNPAHRI
eukprot:Selendium_serpulae@DN1792_c0_g1_i1.p2